MAKYKDKRTLGRSEIVPTRYGEDWRSRHARRKDTALEYEFDTRVWCAEHRLSCKITNDGHHWMFSMPGRVAEWWPSSGKLVFDRKYRRGVHAHDIEQVKREILKRWGPSIYKKFQEDKP